MSSVTCDALSLFGAARIRRSIKSPASLPPTNAKRISKMYQLERELWLSEVLLIHQRSVIYSFIFIHSLMSENDKNVPSIVCDCDLRVVGPLGEKFTFLNSLGTTKISRSLKLSVYINVVLLISFPEQFKLFFYFKY